MQFFDLNTYMIDMVYELIPNIHRQGNQLNFRCPICGDGKKRTSRRGHWYINEGTYYCWNAGCPANGKGLSGLQFLSLLTHKSQYELKTELIQKAGTFQNALNHSSQNQIKSNIFDDLSEKKKHKESLIEQQLLDNNWIDLPSWVQKEIDKRKIYKSPFINRNWKLFYDKKKNRIVIPWTEEYYQLRALTKEQEEQQGKYLFPPDIDKPIFGLNNIDTNFKYLFLLQGVFDAIWVKNGLAVGSLTLSEKQKLLLDNYSDFKIIYFMDNQFKDQSAHDESIKISKQKPFINMFIWPKQLKMFKDVNDSIIYSDQFIKLWADEQFLIKHIANGIKANILLQ